MDTLLQQRAMKTVKGLEDLANEGKLIELGLFLKKESTERIISMTLWWEKERQIQTLISINL